MYDGDISEMEELSQIIANGPDGISVSSLIAGLLNVRVAVPYSESNFYKMWCDTYNTVCIFVSYNNN